MLAATFSALPGTNLAGHLAAFADYNNDGWVDVETGAGLWQNNGGTGFSQVGNLGHGSWGDYDNDGFIDFAMVHTGLVMRNYNGDGIFTEVYLPDYSPGPHEAVTFVDLDSDADLDIYHVGYELQCCSYPRFDDVLIYDSVNNSFTDVWTEPTAREGRGVTTLDFNEDQLMDVYVTNYRLQPNYLWENDGSGDFNNFPDAAPSRGATGGNGHGIGSSVGDFNNDGHIDIFAANFSHPNQPQSRFLINQGPTGNYNFNDSGQAGVGWVESYATSAFGDVDNDGDLDLFITAVYGTPARLYLSNFSSGSFSYTNATAGSGLEGIGVTTQAAFADIDNDGDLDLLSNQGILYVNDTSQTSSNNWLRVKLVGDGLNVNTTALGTIVRAELGNGTIVTRQVEGSTGRANQNEQTLHFGLGSFSSQVPLEITWLDGTVQTTLVSPNQTIELTYEGGGSSHETDVIDVGEVGQITNLTHAHRTITLDRSYVDPVVFVQSPSNNEAQPAVARVTDVQSNQFTVFLAEPTNGDMIHANESATYLVMEAGTHILFDGTRVEVGKLDTTATVGNRISANVWGNVVFDDPFSAPPVILSQIQTNNGPDYLQTRYLDTFTSSSQFKLGMEPQENVTAAVVEETVGYLAIDEATGFWNGMKFEAGVTPDAVSHTPYQLFYDEAFDDSPSLLTSLYSYDNGDNAHVRYLDATSTGVRLKVEEDTTFDTETTHTTEEVAYLALGGEGMLTARTPTVPVLEIGEVGQINNLTHTNQTITLSRTFVNPVVFMQSPSNNEAHPVVARVTNVQSNQFTAFLAEPSNSDSIHGNETVTYLVLEAGRHILSSGTHLEVGTFDTTGMVGNRISLDVWQDVSFTQPFESEPVTLSQIQTHNGTGYLQTRTWDLFNSSSRVRLGLEPQESTTSAVTNETVGFLAIEAGRGPWGDMTYEAGQTPDAVNDSLYQLSYTSPFSTIPNLLTSLASYDSGDNAHVRYANSLKTGVQLKVEEDTSFDMDTSHPTEEVAYLAIAGTGILSAVATVSPPQIVSSELNGGAGAYDSLDTLSYTFNKEVTVAVGDLSLANMGAGGASVNLAGIAFAYDPNTYTAAWDFSSVAGIQASTYNATLASAGITDPLGIPLDGNGDGSGGDDHIQSIVVAGQGDANADSSVDGLDLAIWNQYKFTNTGQWNQADFNRDGVTDVRDFNIWNNHKSLSSTLSTVTLSSSPEPRAPLGDAEPASAVPLSNKMVPYPAQILQSRQESLLSPGGSQEGSEATGLTPATAFVSAIDDALISALDDADGQLLAETHRDDYFANYFHADKQRLANDRDSEGILIDGVMTEFVQRDWGNTQRR